MTVSSGESYTDVEDSKYEDLQESEKDNLEELNEIVGELGGTSTELLLNNSPEKSSL